MEGGTSVNQDLLLFYKLCVGIIAGSLSKDMIGRVLGKLDHARWLTLGSRIMCQYICTASPTRELKVLTQFVIKSYGCAWLKTRLNPKATEVPRLYFEWVKSMQKYPVDVKTSITPILDNGTYWAHSENILLSALSDPNGAIRKRAITHILKIRNDESFKAHKKAAENKIKQMKKCSFKKQRFFVKPVVDYNAESYVDMIGDWDVHALYEPPCTKRLSDDDIRSFELEPISLDIPGNSVLTERTIQTVARFTSLSSSESFREGGVQDRKAKPRLEKKADFVG